jgi:hypothetical protein
MIAGECENNAAFMQERCPGACPKKAARKAAPSTPKPAAPLDANPNCITWASGGECVSNPQYMLGECPHACAAAARGEEVGGDAEDIHQDCAAWVQDGECFRNPAFMLQQCKASCSKFAAANDDILQDTSDSCVNFALRGGCVQDIKKADTICRASCYIQREHAPTTSPRPPLSVCPSARLPVCPSARLPVCPSARLPVCPSARLPVCPAPHYLSVRLGARP